MTDVKLGDKARDSVTGFEGIVTARTDYLGDSASLRLTAETGQADSKERWLPEARCELENGDKVTGFTAP